MGLVVLTLAGGSAVQAQDVASQEAACASVERLLAAGDILITDLRADHGHMVAMGSSHHDSMLALQNLAASAMADTWAANWQSVESWFPTIRAINFYANNEFSRQGAAKTLSVFVTAQPELYDAPEFTIQEVTKRNAWIPGEFLKVCQPIEGRP